METNKCCADGLAEPFKLWSCRQLLATIAVLVLAACDGEKPKNEPSPDEVRGAIALAQARADAAREQTRDGRDLPEDAAPPADRQSSDPNDANRGR